MNKKEILSYKNRLKELIALAEDTGKNEYNGELAEHKELMEVYKIKSPVGQNVYSSFSDEELCEYLRQRAKGLNHVPSQKEIYWILRMYIKQRFVNWPKALRVAVMSSKAGKNGHSYEVIEKREKQCGEMLEKVRAKADELHRPPHMTELKECIDILKYKYDTWDKVLKAAGIDGNWKNEHMLFVVEDFTEEEMQLLERVKTLVEELGRAPLRKEVDEDLRQALKVKCKTWRNTLYQIGVEPVEKQETFSKTYLVGDRQKGGRHREILQGGLFKLVKSGVEEKEDLKRLKGRIKELGRAPIKEELPADMYERLMKACGSYRNLLYQVGQIPLDKSEEQRIKRKLVKGKKETK